MQSFSVKPETVFSKQLDLKQFYDQKTIYKSLSNNFELWFNIK
jgi:hypothetical protein